jgi:cellulose synthase/poly-beta-1,6-N-acetylglucosamine synthase-like glycosyltransferase
MLIPVLDDYYDRGYLPRPSSPALTPFFPNCNLAVRRAAYQQAGGYDPEMNAGEDADLCRRVAAADWELVYQPDATVEHEPRAGWRALLRQWWSYGYAGARHFHKAQAKRLEIYWTAAAWPRIHRHRVLLGWQRAPVGGIVFLTFFPVLLGLFLASGVAALLGASLLASILAALGGLGFAAVVVRRTPGQTFKARLLHALLIVLIDSACTAGCLASTLRRRKLFLYPGI